MYLTNIFYPSLFYLSGQQESCHPDFHFFAIQTAKFLRSGLPLFAIRTAKFLQSNTEHYTFVYIISAKIISSAS